MILPWPRDRLRQGRAATRPRGRDRPPIPARRNWPAPGSTVSGPRRRSSGHADDGIRAGRNAEERPRSLAAARVGQDDGVQHGRDYGPGIRLRPIRARGHRITLRPADVEVVVGTDPDRPNEIMRRARRVDPLTALLKAGTITGRQFDAAEMLRGQLEASEAALTGAAQSEIHVAPHQRMGQSDPSVGKPHVGPRGDRGHHAVQSGSGDVDRRRRHHHGLRSPCPHAPHQSRRETESRPRRTGPSLPPAR